MFGARFASALCWLGARFASALSLLGARFASALSLLGARFASALCWLGARFASAGAELRGFPVRSALPIPGVQWGEVLRSAASWLRGGCPPLA